jgi:NitT/TauT family transport system permease protein
MSGEVHQMTTEVAEPGPVPVPVPEMEAGSGGTETAGRGGVTAEGSIGTSVSRWFLDRIHYLGTAVAAIGLVWLWDWAVSTGRVHSVVMAPPGDVWNRLVEIVQEPFFREHLSYTLREIFVGFGIGVSAAIAMALLSFSYPAFRTVVHPFVIAFQSVPKIVFLPIIVVWFGVGLRSTITLVTLIAFFPTYVNTFTGLSLGNPDGLKLMRSLGASRSQMFWKVRFPTALPLIFTGLKTSMNFSITGAIVGEYLGARYGLGFLVGQYAYLLRIDSLYAMVALIAVFAVIMFGILALLDRKLIFWRERTGRH